jgi:hypothetical protein
MAMKKIMKPQRKSNVMFGFSLILMLLFLGCSSKPNNTQIEEAVKIELKNNIPVSWVGNLMGGSNAKLSTIEVIEFGNFNNEQKYWPVKIRVVGSAESNDPFNSGKVSQFDKVSEFRLSKDDYGKWKASLSGGMFQ